MSALFRADIHCHTTCSDGSESPEAVLRKAKELGLSGLSITDHDTVEAYKEALPLAKELGLPLLAGVEFSAMQATESVHILGYGFALDHPSLHAFCQRHRERREQRNRAILEKLAAGGYPVEWEELLAVGGEGSPLGEGSVGRPHIGYAMMRRGYVKSITEAFKRFLGERAPFFVESQSFSAEETVALIHEVGGYAVIAHPHFIKKRKALRELFRIPFDGLEAYYARLPKNQEGPWARKAEELGWFYTGGSDFHGTAKPHIPLGGSWTREETFQKLYRRHQENNG